MNSPKSAGPQHSAVQRPRPTAPTIVPAWLRGATDIVAETFVYKYSWPKLLGITFWTSIALVCSLILNILQFRHVSPPTYFAETPDGRITQLVPLSEPLVDTQTLLSFAQDTVVDSFILDFDENNLRRKFESLRDHYTRDGFNAWQQALIDSQLIAKIKAQHLISTAVPTGAPVIVSTRRDPEGVKWLVQLPISVTLSSQTERRSYSFIFDVEVRRVPNVDYPKGIAISAMRISSDSTTN